MGVFCKGTDYIADKPKNHAVQPDVEMVIEKVNIIFKKYNYNKIFLTTEDKTFSDKFREVFKDKLILCDKFRVDFKKSDGMSLFDYNNGRKNHIII